MFDPAAHNPFGIAIQEYVDEAMMSSQGNCLFKILFKIDFIWRLIVEDSKQIGYDGCLPVNSSYSFLDYQIAQSPIRNLYEKILPLD